MIQQSALKLLSEDELNSIQSDFLIDSWSYSRVTAFSRNEKAFEMSAIYGQKGRTSSTTVAGSAYHAALDLYFKSLQEGKELDLVDLEKAAYEYIDNQGADVWKIQKTTPTIEDCIATASKTATVLLKNFLAEKSLYLDEIAEILHVEMYFDEYLNINGVDIPLPCHAKVDLCFRSKSSKVVILDHKSKKTFTSDEEIAMTMGIQSISYVKCFESRYNIQVDEVWFVENKYSQNKDKSPQLNAFKVTLTPDTRRLYEALLYEPLRRMLQAVNDPDYVYLINQSDNLVDMAEVYDFWAKTQIAEIDDFNVSDAKKELVARRLKKIRDVSIASINPAVIKNFKENASKFIQYDLSNKDMTQNEKIEHSLRAFNIIVQVAHSFQGYSSDTFLLEVSAGVNINSIKGKALNIAHALNVPNVRIGTELMVYEDKAYLSIEVTKKREADLIYTPDDMVDFKVPIGKDNLGQIVFWDLNETATPHALACGQTRSGKSVCVTNTIEYSLHAGIEEVVIFDPKYEFTRYQDRENVTVYNDILDIEEAMMRLVDSMNDRVKNQVKKLTLVVFDEFADAVANSRKGKDLDIYEMVQTGTYKQTITQQALGLPAQAKYSQKKTGELKPLEENLRVLLQKGASSGFRVLAATQRASVKVITGDAKVNFPVLICFRVPKEVDSKVVLDESGAELLAAKGDGLIKSPDFPQTTRFQAYFKPE